MVVFAKAELDKEKNLSRQTCLQAHSLPRLRVEGESGVLDEHQITPSR